jgi:hypothetical protein
MMTNRVRFADGFGTRFSVTVDTEEEFEWAGDYSRAGHTVTTSPAIAQGQAFFEGAGVRPLYYIDYPILTDDAAAAMFRGFADRNAADFGVHLHPWVTPPFDEELSRPNSYVGNLPADVERAKLRHVRAAMIDRLGVTPRAYRAGRYGIGPNTHGILREEGFDCDSSVRALFDYRADGGPDFRAESLFPNRDNAQHMLSLPLTTAYIGTAKQFGRSIYGRLGHHPVAASALSRTGLLKRVPLTPEGVPAALACQAIDAVLDLGLDLLTLSFHSPSLAIGHTPYVRDVSDLAALYQWFDTVFAHLARRGVTAAGLDEILAAAGIPAPAQAALAN